MDELIDQMLHEERVFDILLPRLVKRSTLEELEGLQRYISPLEDELLNEDNVLSDLESSPEDEVSVDDFAIHKKETDNLSQIPQNRTLSAEELEFEEANALRLKLGLKPLRR